MDVVKQRRTTLTPTASPRTGLDYLVSLGGRLEAPPWPEPIAVALRYVPDDLVLAPASLRAYLTELGASEWETLEQLGAAMAGDIDAELLPRWMRVRLSARVADNEHQVDFEQTKPGWDNRMLLARMRID
jgi:7-cyano-7-deazaguanine reductase